MVLMFGVAEQQNQINPQLMHTDPVFHEITEKTVIKLTKRTNSLTKQTSVEVIIVLFWSELVLEQYCHLLGWRRTEPQPHLSCSPQETSACLQSKTTSDPRLFQVQVLINKPEYQWKCILPFHHTVPLYVCQIQTGRRIRWRWKVFNITAAILAPPQSLTSSSSCRTQQTDI